MGHHNEQRRPYTTSDPGDLLQLNEKFRPYKRRRQATIKQFLDNNKLCLHCELVVNSEFL